MKAAIFTLILIVIVAVVILGVEGVIIFMNKRSMNMVKKLQEEQKGQIPGEVLVLGGVVSFIILLIGILGFAPFETVSTGYVGVETRMGAVTGQLYPPGFHIISPLSDLEEVSTMINVSEADYEANTVDNQIIHVKMIVNYSISREHVLELFQQVKGDYYQTIISPAAQEILKSQIALLKVGEILSKRPEIKERIHHGLTDWTIKYGIIINEVSLSNVVFSKEYVEAIERKQIEEQKALQKQYELIQAQKNAEIREATALGEAKALRADADARAYFNEKTAATASDKVVALRYLEKWDGKLPVYTMGDSIPLMSIPSQIK